MEPISTAVSGYFIDKLTDVFEGAFRKHVVERWTRKRAIEFYRQFSHELMEDNLSGEDLELRLEDLLSDSKNSEIVWEAYRLVSLSRSKTIGPRIIAVMVAKIVQRDGIADDQEEILLQAAEMLSDCEFIQLQEQINHMKDSQTGPSFTELLGTQSIDPNWPNSEIDVGPVSLTDEYGLWAQKLSTLGLISQSSRQSQHPYHEDSERHIDSDGVFTKYVFSATFHPACIRLSSLVAKVSGDSVP